MTGIEYPCSRVLARKRLYYVQLVVVLRVTARLHESS